jgi:hypothetical protein
VGHRSVWPVPLALELLACGPGPPLTTYELSGRITVLLETGDSDEGVPEATVRFTSDTARVVETTADGDGRYRMLVATDHEFGQVRAEAAGFLPGEATVYFDAPQRRVDIALRRVE